MVADGPLEVAKLARLCIREGADSIKLNISGDDHTRTGALARIVMNEPEIRAGVTVAHDFHRKVYFVCTLLSTIWALGDFNSVRFVSGGGPALSTLPLLIPLVIQLMR